LDQVLKCDMDNTTFNTTGGNNLKTFIDNDQSANLLEGGSNSLNDTFLSADGKNQGNQSNQGNQGNKGLNKSMMYNNEKVKLSNEKDSLNKSNFSNNDNYKSNNYNSRTFNSGTKVNDHNNYNNFNNSNVDNTDNFENYNPYNNIVIDSKSPDFSPKQSNNGKNNFILSFNHNFNRGLKL